MKIDDFLKECNNIGYVYAPYVIHNNPKVICESPSISKIVKTRYKISNRYSKPMIINKNNQSI
jgi:hypothetical protein